MRGSRGGKGNRQERGRRRLFIPYNELLKGYFSMRSKTVCNRYSSKYSAQVTMLGEDLENLHFTRNFMHNKIGNSSLLKYDMSVKRHWLIKLCLWQDCTSVFDFIIKTWALTIFLYIYVGSSFIHICNFFSSQSTEGLLHLFLKGSCRKPNLHAERKGIIH